MASMRAAKPCADPGCPTLVRNGARCRQHAKKTRERYDAARGTAAERGYDHRWRRIRNRKLRASPLCERCEEQGRVTPGDMVHHILPIADGGTHAWANLQTVCVPCHGEIHAALARTSLT